MLGKNGLGRTRRSGSIDVRQDDGRAFASEPARNGLTDALRGAGYERDLVAESFTGCHGTSAGVRCSPPVTKARVLKKGNPVGVRHRLLCDCKRITSRCLHAWRHSWLITRCSCSPNPSIPKRTRSPGFKKMGGFFPSPTPGGVPVLMMSPGSSGMN